jgi:hypothetical protein
MLLLLLCLIVALLAGSFLRALVSETFASGLSHVAGAISGFFEFKAALRNARTAATTRAPRGRFA